MERERKEEVRDPGCWLYTTRLSPKFFFKYSSLGVSVSLSLCVGQRSIVRVILQGLCFLKRGLSLTCNLPCQPDYLTSRPGFQKSNSGPHQTSHLPNPNYSLIAPGSKPVMCLVLVLVFFFWLDLWSTFYKHTTDSRRAGVTTLPVSYIQVHHLYQPQISLTIRLLEL